MIELQSCNNDGGGDGGGDGSGYEGMVIVARLW